MVSHLVHDRKNTTRAPEIRTVGVTSILRNRTLATSSFWTNSWLLRHHCLVMSEGDRLKILLVDDEPSILRAISVATEMGDQWQSRQAASAEQALELIEDDMPDVIISDKNMPGMSGIELLRRVRRMSRDVSFHLLTGFANGESVHQAMALDIDSYIRKPFRNVFQMLQGVREAHYRRMSRNDSLRERGTLRVEASRPRTDSSSGTERLRAAVVMKDEGDASRVLDLVQSLFPGQVEVYQSQAIGDIPKTAQVILADNYMLDPVAKTCPDALLAVLSEDITDLDKLIGLADRGISAVSRDVPDVELRAQLVGFFGRARPSLKRDDGSDDD